MKIYIASKVKHAEKWRRLRAEGCDIISTWIDEAEPGQTQSRRDLALRCISESAEADILILYAEEGDILKGALIECGVALAAGVKVYGVGPCLGKDSAFRYHPSWVSADNIDIVLSGIERKQQPKGD